MEDSAQPRTATGRYEQYPRSFCQSRAAHTLDVYPRNGHRLAIRWNTGHFSPDKSGRAVGARIGKDNIVRDDFEADIDPILRLNNFGRVSYQWCGERRPTGQSRDVSPRRPVFSNVL